jgi:4-hydroxybenzoate polyprenyltransferase
MIKTINFIVKEFLYNGHLQSLSAVSIVYITSRFILDDVVNVYMLITVYLFFELIHIFDRYKDLDKDKLTNSIRVKHINSYADFVRWLLIGVSLLIFISITTTSNIFTLFLTIAIILLGIYYPIYFKRLTIKIPLFKNFYVAAVYSIMVFYTTAFLEGRFIITPEYLVFAYFILFEIVANQAMSDFKDIEGDRGEKLKTLPVIFGKVKARKYLKFFSILNFLVYLALIQTYLLHPVFIFMGIVGLVLNFISMELAKRELVVGYLMNVGKFLILLLFILLTGFIWFN